VRADQSGDTKNEEALWVNLRFLRSGLGVDEGRWWEGEDVKMDVEDVNGAGTGVVRGLARKDVHGERQKLKAYAIPEKSKAERYFEMMEHVFGPGNAKRGNGPKPKVSGLCSCSMLGC